MTWIGATGIKFGIDSPANRQCLTGQFKGVRREGADIRMAGCFSFYRRWLQVVVEPARLLQGCKRVPAATRLCQDLAGRWDSLQRMYSCLCGVYIMLVVCI